MVNLNRWQINLISSMGLSFLLLLLVFMMGTVESTTVSPVQRFYSPVVFPEPNSHTAPPTTTMSLTMTYDIKTSSVTTQTFIIHGRQTGQVNYNRFFNGKEIILTPHKSFHSCETVQITLRNTILGTV